MSSFSASLLDLKVRIATCAKVDLQLTLALMNLQRLILTYLTASRLPLGIFPRFELLQEFGLDAPFWGLIEALKVSKPQEYLIFLGEAK